MAEKTGARGGLQAMQRFARRDSLVYGLDSRGARGRVSFAVSRLYCGSDVWTAIGGIQIRCPCV